MNEVNATEISKQINNDIEYGVGKKYSTDASKEAWKKYESTVFHTTFGIGVGILFLILSFVALLFLDDVQTYILVEVWGLAGVSLVFGFVQLFSKRKKQAKYTEVSQDETDVLRSRLSAFYAQIAFFYQTAAMSEKARESSFFTPANMSLAVNAWGFEDIQDSLPDVVLIPAPVEVGLNTDHADPKLRDMNAVRHYTGMLICSKYGTLDMGYPERNLDDVLVYFPRPTESQIMDLSFRA